jgi:hypothetical protein
MMRIQSADHRKSGDDASGPRFSCADIEDCQKSRIAAIVVSRPHREETAWPGRQGKRGICARPSPVRTDGDRERNV